MLWKFLQHADLFRLAGLARPDLFSVAPIGAVMGELGELAAGAFDDERARQAHATRAESLLRPGLQIEMPAAGQSRRNSKLERAPEQLPEDARRRRMQAVAALYFAQIFQGGPLYIDIGSQSVSGPDDFGRIRWEPAPLFFALEAGFADGIQNVYRALFADQREKARAALDNLGLDVLAPVFLQHFQSADLDRAELRMRQFTETFTNALQELSAARRPLPRGMLALGLHLGSLYEHAEVLQTRADLREAFAHGAGKETNDFDNADDSAGSACSGASEEYKPNH